MNEKKITGTSTLIERIVKKATAHYGTDIRFVGIKYEPNTGWIAKIKFYNFPSLVEMSTTSSEKALRKLDKRIDKIIKRYYMV